MPAHRMRWTSLNTWIYRTGHRLSARRPLPAALLTALDELGADAPVASAPLLYLANGRLGDALLAAAFTGRYRTWFGEVVAVARPETAAVLRPHVDRLVAFDPNAAADAVTGPRALMALRESPYRGALGDLHLFHGGAAFTAIAAAMRLPLLAYDGWIDRARQAPTRRWPAGTTVVPAVDKGDAIADPERLHVVSDLAHHHRAALRHFGVNGELPSRPELPAHLRAPAIAATFALRNGYVACHAQSSQPKKDWPLDRFAALFAAVPEVPFVVLGTSGAALPPRANVVDLRGRTDVAQAIAIAANARAFVGIDSGLAHAAALAAVPTVVVMPQATPGYFFPYPRAFGAHVATVRSATHEGCAGCGGLCAHEPIWRSRRDGFPCLRAVAVDDVVAAFRRAVATPRG